MENKIFKNSSLQDANPGREVVHRRRHDEWKLAHLASIVESSRDAIMSHTWDGIITSFNSGAERILGYRAEEVVYRHISLLISPDRNDEFSSVMEKLKAGERIDDFETVWRAKDGALVDVSLTVSPIRDADGRIPGLSLVAHNITARKRTQEALRQSQASLADAQRIAHLGNWDWNIVTNELHWSDEMYRIFGLTPQEFGATYEAFLKSVHPDDQEFVKKSVNAALRDKKPYCVDYRVVWPDGTQRSVHAQGEVTFDEDGNPLRMMGTVQDITERKNAELALAALKDDMALQVKILTRLHKLAMTLTGTLELRPALQTILGAFVDIHGADYGVLLLHDPLSDSLRLEAGTGLDQSAIRSLDRIKRGPDGGACGITFETMTRTIIDDFETDPRVSFYSSIARRIGFRAAHCTPILTRSGSFLGVMTVYFKKPRWPTPRETQLADLCARHAAETVETIRNQNALRESEELYRLQTHSLEIINSVGKTLAAELDLDKLLQAVTDAGREVTGAEFGAFFYADRREGGENYVLHALSGAPCDNVEELVKPQKNPFFTPIFAGSSPVRIGDVLKDPRYGQIASHNGIRQEHLPVRSYLAVPVISRSSRILGSLLFGHSQPEMFTEQSEKIVAGIAGQAAIAIDNANLYKTVQMELAKHQQMEDDLAKSNQELEQFAYIASHDLQEPLNMIRSFVDLLVRRCEPKLESKDREYLEFIKQGARQARTMIEDLLEYSRAGRRMPFETVDLQAVMREVETNLKASIKESRATIRHTGLPRIRGDYMAMVRVFQNLVSNAIKYRGPAPPKIDISFSRGDDNMWLFAVKDNGIGIDPKYKDRIFAMFQRLHPKSEYSGTGIGLAICKKIIEYHGGKIWVESEPGKGAVFYFTIGAL